MTTKRTGLSPYVVLLVVVLVALLLVVPTFMRLWFLELSGFTWSLAWAQILSEFQKRFEISASPWKFVAQLLWTAPALLIIPIAFFNRVAAAVFALIIPTVALLVYSYGYAYAYALLPQDRGPYLASGLFCLIGLVLLPPFGRSEASHRPHSATMLASIALFLACCIVIALGHFEPIHKLLTYVRKMGTFLTPWELVQQNLAHFLPVFSLLMGLVVIPLLRLRPHWIPRYALAFAALLLIIMGWIHAEFVDLSAPPLMLPWIVLGMVTLLCLTWRSARLPGGRNGGASSS